MNVRRCKHCNALPILSDVGGNNPYYELGCKCKNGLVVGSSDKEDVINCWNILNKRGENSG